MSKPTPQELEQLDRLARKHHEQLYFLRHSPREHRNMPFEEDSPRAASFREALFGTLVFFLFIATLALAPWGVML